MLLFCAELLESAGGVRATPMEFTAISELQQCKELLPSMPQPYASVKECKSVESLGSVCEWAKPVRTPINSVQGGPILTLTVPGGHFKDRSIRIL